MEEVSQSLLSPKNNNNQMQKGAIDYYSLSYLFQSQGFNTSPHFPSQ
jgi:hypothetical protein